MRGLSIALVTFPHLASSFSSISQKVMLPRLIVFDLDDCLWTPEMYTLPQKPSNEIQGVVNEDTGDRGVVGVQCGSSGPTVKLFSDARRVLQRIHNERDTTFQHTQFAVASSSEEPSYSRSCLEKIDILPGVKMKSLFPYQQIGRTGALTSRKTTHFDGLKRESNIEFPDMLFFDDCNWGDHVGDLHKTYGVIGVRTPYGLTWDQFEEGLQSFAASKKK